MSNQILQFDLRTIADRGCPPKIFNGHLSTFYVKSSTQGNLLASGSSDRLVYIWDSNKALISDGDGDLVANPEPILRLGSTEKLNGHLHEVNEVTWASDTRLLSSSDDASVLVWDLLQH